MLHESRTGYSASYTYDTSGRRTSKTVNSNTENYTYSGGRLTEVGSTTFGYDNNSRRTSMVTGSDTTSYGYDYEDRLTSVTPPGASAITYVYNGLGSRVGRGSEEYRRAGASAGSPLLGDGSASYTPGLSERRGGQSSFFHWGSFGDLSAQSNGSGALTDLHSYDWFLGIVAHTGSSPSPIGAGGGYVDPDTGGINHGGGGEYEPGLGGGPSVAQMILPDNGNVDYGIDYGPPVDVLIVVANFCAGWGDPLAFGIPAIIREGLGVNGIVNQDSAAYNAGNWVSIGHTFFLPTPKMKVLAFLDRVDGLHTAIGGGHSHHIVPRQVINWLRDNNIPWMDSATYSSYMHKSWNQVYLPDIYHQAIHNGWGGFERYNDVFMQMLRNFDNPTEDDVLGIAYYVIEEYGLMRWML